jgi:undecaprenyl-diphosphatase
MDLKLFHLIHNLAGKNSFVDSIMAFISEWGLVLLIAGIIALIFFSSTKKYGIYGVVSLAIGLLLNRVLKILIDRPRPFVTHDIEILIPKEASPSFPSDQALIAGIFLATFWLVKTKIRWLAVLAASLLIISRVYVGHHYPSDVIIGSLLGIVIVIAVYNWLNRKHYFSHKHNNQVNQVD